MNLIETNFLDVMFNLVTEKYFSYRKPNNDSLYMPNQIILHHKRPPKNDQ